LAKQKSLEVRIAIDQNLLGIRKSFKRTEQRAYWWGPRYSGSPLDQPHGMTVHGPTINDQLNSLIRTEFWWYGKSIPTFEIEEIVDNKFFLASGVTARGMRFIHSMCDVKGRPFHIDGAIRLYSESLWCKRKAEKISDFGKRAERIKLWRVDGELENDAWYELIHNFFRGNYTVGEYFGLPTPERYRAEYERSLLEN